MTFRAKVRKALKGNKSGDDSPSSRNSNRTNPPQRTDIEYYKSDEIPQSKYRGPWNQKHQDKLEAFSFEDAFRDRKASVPAAYSPRGTQVQSRRSSWMSRTRSSLGGSSSHAEDGVSARGRSQVAPVDECAENDAGARNVGLSRPPAGIKQRPTSEAADKLALQKTFTPTDVKQGDSHLLFDLEGLCKA